MKKLMDQAEAISQVYAAKNEIERTPEWFLLKIQEELGELTQAYLRTKRQARTKGKTDKELRKALAEETADVLCHILLFAKHNRIDLEKAIQKKWLKYL